MPRVEREASLVRPLSLMRLADNRQPCWGHAQRVPTRLWMVATGISLLGGEVLLER